MRSEISRLSEILAKHGNFKMIDDESPRTSKSWLAANKWKHMNEKCPLFLILLFEWQVSLKKGAPLCGSFDNWGGGGDWDLDGDDFLLWLSDLDDIGVWGLGSNLKKIVRYGKFFGECLKLSTILTKESYILKSSDLRVFQTSKLFFTNPRCFNLSNGDYKLPAWAKRMSM
jgi:hypothetical protein